jgi:hypothetical protein
MLLAAYGDGSKAIAFTDGMLATTFSMTAEVLRNKKPGG